MPLVSCPRCTLRYKTITPPPGKFIRCRCNHKFDPVPLIPVKIPEWSVVTPDFDNTLEAEFVSDPKLAKPRPAMTVDYTHDYSPPANYIPMGKLAVGKRTSLLAARRQRHAWTSQRVAATILGLLTFCAILYFGMPTEMRQAVNAAVFSPSAK